MNYMDEVAKILGVQLGEYFKINGHDGTFVLIYDGLHHVEGGFKVEGTFNDLLAGKCSIKRKPWKPKFEEKYYSIGVDGSVEDGVWMNDYLDYSLYKLGNCYKTIDAARADRHKWGRFYDSDEVLEA